MTTTPQLLAWARSLQAIAQSGLAYEPTVYEQERYTEVRRIAAEMAAAPDGRDADAIDGLFRREVGHATPKVDVRAAVFRDDRILLVREAADGGWSLPGGWADVGETPSEAAERELVEESGYAARAVKVIGVYERDRHATRPHAWHIWKIVFLCELEDVKPSQRGPETSDARFFSREDAAVLPHSRATPELVERCFAHHDDPSLPTDFD